MAGPVSMNASTNNGWQNPGTQQPGMGMNYMMPSNQQPYPSTFQTAPGVPQVQFVGRWIENPIEILPNEVPMDGRAAIFPNKSFEEIYLKIWNANGEMKTLRYILDTSQNLT